MPLSNLFTTSYILCALLIIFSILALYTKYQLWLLHIRKDVIEALLIIRPRIEAIERTGYENIQVLHERRTKIKDGWYRKTTIHTEVVDSENNRSIPITIKTYQEKSQGEIIVQAEKCILSETNKLTRLGNPGTIRIRKTDTHICYPDENHKKYKNYKLFHHN